jgi:hypothetical protein
MGPLAIGILALTIAGALASWIVAAVYGVRALAAIEGPGAGRLRLLAIVAWPFAVRRLEGVASEHAAVVNKAIVAFFVCLTLAVATISLSTNFNRISRAP